MKEKIIAILASLVGIFLSFIILQIAWSYNSCISVPVVINDTEGGTSRLCITAETGSGRLFISNLPVKDYYFQYSAEFARLAACNLEPDKCKLYDYFLSIDSESLKVMGPSGSSAIALLILGAINNVKRHVDCTVSGFVLPSGLLLPIGGLKEKEEGSLLSGYKCMIAPNIDKNVTSIGTLPQLFNFYYNVSTYKNNTYVVPRKYFEIIKQIAYDICSNISNKNVTMLLRKGYFYSAASICYGLRSGQNVNKSLEQIKKEVVDLRKQVNSLNCNNYNCEEIKYQVLSRLDEALEYLNQNSTNKAYWRLYTAKQWLRFMTLGYNRYKNAELTRRIYEILYTFSYDLGVELEDTDNYFKMKEESAKVEAALALTYYNDNIDSLLNRTWYLINFYLGKYGFTVSAYNYYEYSKGLYEIGDKKSSVYYAFLALEYTLP